MAMSTTYDYGGAVAGSGVWKEDVMDDIINVSPKETPLWSTLAKVPCRQILHTWPHESDAAAADNAQVEGVTYTYTTDTAPTLLTNWTQIIMATLQVSKSSQAGEYYGMSSLYNHRLAIKQRKAANDTEYALWNGTGNSGSGSGTARRMKGVVTWITTNVATSGSDRYLSANQAVLDSLLSDIWTSGASPMTWKLYCGGYQKIQLTQFTAQSLSKNIDAGKYKIVNNVEVYDGPMGMIEVVMCRYCPTDELTLLDQPRWRCAIYRPFEHTRAPAGIGSYEAGAIEGELTLECLAQELSGVVEDLEDGT